MRWLYVLIMLWCVNNSRALLHAQGFLNHATIPEVQVTLEEPTLHFDAQGHTLARIQVTIPPDHHGYLDKGEEGFYIPLMFTFVALEERGARVVEISRPQGERDDQVHATILRGNGQFVFGIDTSDPAQFANHTLLIKLRHQICNDITRVCYPPKEVSLPVAFLDATVVPLATAAPPAQPSLTLNERVAELFQRFRGNLLLTLGVVFLAGLLASATPCVYPMIPITSALMMARGAGSRQRGRLHAFVYCCGMVLFYALLGFFASTTGTALSAIMTNAWVNVGFALVFAYLGMSMMGAYDFQFFTTWLSKLDAASSRWHGVSGTFLMGVTAGLIVSPCVGPISGAILLDISHQAASGAIGDGLRATALRGAGLMASFGSGLGVPFILVGLLSHRLPHSGPWVARVKWLLGLPILYIAYLYYLKGMETAAVPSPVAHAILLGVLAITGAVFAGAFHAFEQQPSSLMLLRRAIGITLLIIGVYFLYNGLGQSGILLPSVRSLSSEQGLLPQPSSGTLAPGPTTSVEKIGNLIWERDFSLAQQRARIEGKPIFVDFYATWCANCKAFQQLTLKDERLNKALQQAVLVKIYDTDAGFSVFQQDSNFPELRGVGGQPLLPLFAIYSSHGIFLWKGQDYQAIMTMTTQLTHAKQRISP